MGYKNKSKQTVCIWVTGTQEQITEWIEDFQNDWKTVGFTVEAEQQDDDFIVVNLYGNVKYYPSTSYWEPDDYEFDEVFVDECDPDFVKDEWFKDSPVKATKVDIGEIECIDYDYE